MTIALWITAGLLAATFAGAGLMKLTQPRVKLADSGLAWTEDASDGQVKAIGLIEILGAIGLMLPAALDIAPILVPVAATGLSVTMLGATAVHTRRRELTNAVVTLVIAAFAAFVAVMRFGPYAF